MMHYKAEEAIIRNRLEDDIKRYLASGHKIEQVPLGKSTPVDATNEWPAGFYNEDNIMFYKKRPRPR
jgi:hypothetical protein